jgi:hypothetical protein
MGKIVKTPLIKGRCPRGQRGFDLKYVINCRGKKFFA